MRYAAGVLLIAAGYYVAAQSGETLLLTGGVGAFWPATGVGIALLYVGGLHWWPGILLGDLVGTIVDLPGGRQPLGIALADTARHVARAVVAALILQRLIGRRAVMDRLVQVGAVLVGVAIGEALAATVALLARLTGASLPCLRWGSSGGAGGWAGSRAGWW